MDKFYTKEDCIRDLYDESVANNERCIGIIKPDALKPEYQKPIYQLFYMESGFGTVPNSRGNAVFGKFIYDKRECRMEKFDFIGVANKDITEYALNYAKDKGFDLDKLTIPCIFNYRGYKIEYNLDGNENYVVKTNGSIETFETHYDANKYIDELIIQSNIRELIK